MDSNGVTLNAVQFKTYLGEGGTRDKCIRVDTSKLTSLHAFSRFLFGRSACDLFVVQRGVEYNLAVYWTQSPTVLYALFRDLSEGSFDPWVASMRKSHFLNLRPSLFRESRAYFVKTNQFLSDIKTSRYIRYEDLLTHCRRFFYSTAPHAEFFDTFLMYSDRPIFDYSVEKGPASFYIKCILVRIEGARRSNDLELAMTRFRRLKSYVDDEKYVQFKLNFFSTGYIDLDTLDKAPFGVTLALSQVATFQPQEVSEFSVNQAYVYLDRRWTEKAMSTFLFNPTHASQTTCAPQSLGFVERNQAAVFRQEKSKCQYWQPGSTEGAAVIELIVAIRIDYALLVWNKDKTVATNKNECYLKYASISFNGKKLTIIWNMHEKVEWPGETFKSTPYVRTQSSKAKYLKMDTARLIHWVGYDLQNQRLEWTKGPLTGRPFIPGTAFLTGDDKKYNTVLECKRQHPDLKIVMPRWQPGLSMDYMDTNIPAACFDFGDQWLYYLHRKEGNVTFAVAFMAMERRLGWPAFDSHLAAFASSNYVPLRMVTETQSYVEVDPIEIIRQLSVTPPEMHDEYKHRILKTLKSPFHPFWRESHKYQSLLIESFPELIAMRLHHLHTTKFSQDLTCNVKVNSETYYNMLAAALNQSAFKYGRCTCVLLTREIYKLICWASISSRTDFKRMLPTRTIFIPTFLVDDFGETVIFRERALNTRAIEQMVDTTLRAAAYHTHKHIWPYVWTKDTKSEVVTLRLQSIAKVLHSRFIPFKLEADASSVMYREIPVELEPSPGVFFYVRYTDICVVSYDVARRDAPRNRSTFEEGVPVVPIEKALVRFALWPHVEKYDYVLNGGDIEDYEAVPSLQDDREDPPAIPRTSINPV